MKYQVIGENNRIGQYRRPIRNSWRRSTIILAFLVVFVSSAFGQLTTADILGCCSQCKCDSRKSCNERNTIRAIK
jgi:hypothetical protein